MQVAIVHTLTFFGIHALDIRIETHISNGLPKFSMLGLPETAVKESKERVRSALINSQFEFPNRRITVNLSPAEFPKSDSGFDLSIALSILCASKQLPETALEQYVFIGELALNGEIRPINTVLPALLSDSKKILIIPKENVKELEKTNTKDILYASHLLEIASLLKDNTPLPIPSTKKHPPVTHHKLDWSDINGQSDVKRALEIAVSGGHHALLYGPPGCGKTMFAQRLNTLLPTLSDKKQLETKILHAISKKDYQKGGTVIPPFREPHHSSTAAAILGGGNPIKPGEISLAHNGILFLDELPEFKRDVLEGLREPLENKGITISRATQTLHFPANFQLVGAFNPCPCGYHGHKGILCHCSSEQINQYQKKTIRSLVR